jgi:hypothetical protein
VWNIVRGLIRVVTILVTVVIFPQVASADDCILVSSDGTPLTYTPTLTPGGAGGIQDFGINENRTTQLAKTYTVTFECLNNNTVDLSVNLNTMNAPNFASNSADNLDLINGDTVGVTHLVDVDDITNSHNLVTNITANSNGVLIVNPVTDGNNLNLDVNKRITLNITSRFVLTGGAEELGAGNYNTELTAEVTPDVSGASIDHTTNINGSVDKECSVQTPSQFTQGGGITPIPYQVTTGIVGGEDRATKLQASDYIVFDCNTGGFQYTVNLDNVSAPNFSNAQNIDLVTNPLTDTGVDHQVDVKLKFPSGNVSDSSTTYSKVITGNIITDNSSNIDANGDLEIELTSRFQTINSAKELGQGNYETRFTISVTAQ